MGLTPTDSRWIGAWWLPFTIAAVLSLLNALPFVCYRKDIQGAEEFRQARKLSGSDYEPIGDEEDEDGGEEEEGGRSALKRIVGKTFTSPTFLFLNVFDSCLSFIIAGFTSFGPKIFEVSFALTAATAATVYGAVLLPAGAGGTILGGIVVDRLKLSCDRIILIEAALAACVTACVCLLLLTCDSVDLASANAAYVSNLSSEAYNVTNVCNFGCDCQHVAYNPICSRDNFMYYSPCHAGCRALEFDGKTKYYHNCSCLVNSSNDSLETTSMSCSQDSCPVYVLSVSVFFFAAAFVFVCLTMNMAATSRCVVSSQTYFEIGVRSICSNFPAVGTIVGPIFFGMAFDKTCILWQYDECGTRGSCLVYDNKAFSVDLFTTCFTVSFMSIVSLVLAFVFCKRQSVEA